MMMKEATVDQVRHWGGIVLFIHALIGGTLLYLWLLEEDTLVQNRIEADTRMKNTVDHIQELGTPAIIEDEDGRLLYIQPIGLPEEAELKDNPLLAPIDE